VVDIGDEEVGILVVAQESDVSGFDGNIFV
jgi:hypothetical protein